MAKRDYEGHNLELRYYFKRLDLICAQTGNDIEVSVLPKQVFTSVLCSTEKST